MYTYSAVIILMLSSALAFADETAELSEWSELRESITIALVSATNDPDGEVRFAAFSALQDQPRSDAIVQAFRRGLDDDKANVRQLALTKLVDYEGATEEVLERLISAINQRDLSATASSLLRRIGEPAVPHLLESLKSEKAGEKLTVIGILQTIQLGKHRQEAVTEVTAALQDPDREVRLAAIYALKGMANPPRQVVTTRSGNVIEPKYRKYAVALIAKYDTNRDGMLTEDEWSQMNVDRSSADQDNDGRITPTEFAWYFSQQR